jgi:monoamine oxidase
MPVPVLIMAQLLRIFGDQASSPINAAIKDWAAEPLTASKNDQKIANHHPFNRWSTSIEPDSEGGLIWSGSETADSHTNGYLEGAVLSGNQTFRQLQLALKQS